MNTCTLSTAGAWKITKNGFSKNKCLILEKNSSSESFMSKLQGKLRGIFEIPSTTGWWFQIFFMFTPNFGEDSHFDEHIFGMGGSTQLENVASFVFFFRRGKDQNHKVPPFWCPTSLHDIASRFPKLGLNWRRLRRSHGFRLEDFFWGGLKN